MDEVKEKYLKYITAYFSKRYDERYFGVIENMKFQDGLVVHIDHELKSDAVPRFIRENKS